MKKKLLILLIVTIQLTDVAVHAGAGQLEVMRVIGSVVITVVSLVALFLSGKLLTAVVVSALGVYALLNGWFLVQNSIFNDGALRIGLMLFVALTVLVTLRLARLRTDQTD